MVMLPIFLDPNRNFMMMQNKWSSDLNPLLANPLNEVLILKNIGLMSGTNVINHMLSKVQQGWFLTDIQGVATIYRSAPFNNLTLTLHSSANVTVNIGVF
jgi:hypothetical protein